MTLLLTLLACSDSRAPAASSPPAPPTAPATGPSLEPHFDGIAPRNVIFLSVDTLRHDHFSIYGADPTLTPFLSELSAESYVVDDVNSCSDWTVAATACVESGASNVDRAPDRGMVPILLQSPLRDIPSGESMLPTWLGDAGYSSLLVTANAYFSGQYGNAQGYDAIHWVAGSAHDVWEATADRIDPTRGGIPLPEPFFLHLHFMEPHRPYDAPAEYITGLEDLEPTPFDLSTAQGQEAADSAMAAGTLTDDEIAAIQAEMRVRYDGEVRWWDDGLREVWDGLDALGLLDDALVVFWSDHGEELWEHGPPGHAWLLYHGENDTMLMFWARNIAPGRWEGPVNQIDVAPTVLQLEDLALPETVTGTPLGLADDDRARFAFTDGYVGPISSARKGTKLLHFRWMNVDGELNLGYYDTATDPGEQVNLYDGVAPSADLAALWDELLPQVQAAEPWVEEDPRAPVISWPAGLPH